MKNKVEGLVHAEVSRPGAEAQSIGVHPSRPGGTRILDAIKPGDTVTFTVSEWDQNGAGIRTRRETHRLVRS